MSPRVCVEQFICCLGNHFNHLVFDTSSWHVLTLKNACLEHKFESGHLSMLNSFYACTKNTLYRKLPACERCLQAAPVLAIKGFNRPRFPYYINY